MLDVVGFLLGLLMCICLVLCIIGVVVCGITFLIEMIRDFRD